MLYDPGIRIEEREDVYSPGDDSILLIESLEIRDGERVLEIGCGSGVVAIHCAKNGADVTAVDINAAAVELTRKNAAANGAYMDVRLSDLYEDIDSHYDTIVFNLPYLPVNDTGTLEKAWSGGDDGIGPLPKLLNEVEGHLFPRGRFVIVTSSLMDQQRLDEVLDGYDVTVIGERKLFFELLKVLEIRL
ncbi:MAG: methyltransferase [Methanomassiliicoccaceae archaeon]|jgi:release factor glutamine methyltransferase|nr:methyltransferase [Methanomassiliicoccaceae archaeon]